MTAADIIAARIAAAGCRHAFGIPGGEVLSIMDALERAGVAFTLTKHENAAGFMAEGSWHATGAPGVLVATIGPGLANGINSIVNALQDQTPLIVISGAADEAEAATYTHQVFDQAAFMAPIVKGAFRIADGAVDVMIDKAVALAVADPPGPVHVDLAATLAPTAQPAPRRYGAPRQSACVPAPGRDFSKARALIAGSARPILLAGVGALHHGAGDALTRAAEQLGAPVLTTYKAKGLLDEGHPLSLGGHGLSPKSDKLVLPLLAASDCVISVGYDPIEMRHGWIDPFPPDRHVELTHAPTLHGMHGAAISFHCDVGLGLDALLEGVPPRSAQGAGASSWEDDAPETARTALAEQFGDRDEWGPHQAFAAARRASPANAVATADSGAHRILFSQMWRCPSPRRLVQSSAFCTMGVALPLAIGLKRAAPETPVLGVMGDAGFEMVLGELATARDLAKAHDFALPLMVMVDQSLALIEMKQRASQLPNLGVDFAGGDLPGVAAALGCVGHWIDDAETLEARLAEAFADTGRVTVLACRIGLQPYDGAF